MDHYRTIMGKLKILDGIKLQYLKQILSGHFYSLTVKYTASCSKENE